MLLLLHLYYTALQKGCKMDSIRKMPQKRRCSVFLIVYTTAAVYAEQLHSPNLGYYIRYSRSFEPSAKQGKRKLSICAQPFFRRHFVVQSWKRTLAQTPKEQSKHLQKLKASGEIQHSKRMCPFPFWYALAGVSHRGWAAHTAWSKQRFNPAYVIRSQNFALQQLIASGNRRFFSGRRRSARPVFLLIRILPNKAICPLHSKSAVKIQTVIDSFGQL